MVSQWKRKNNHSYDYNENPKYFLYNNRSYHHDDRHPMHYNSHNAYQPLYSNHRSHQQNRFNSNSETKVKTSKINKNSNDELYNITHNYIKRYEPNTICYIWPDNQQTRNCLQIRIGNEYINSKKKQI